MSAALPAPAMRYDLLFKLLMGHPRVVRHLIRGFLQPRLGFPLSAAQWQDLDKEWITPDLEIRVSDKAWLLRDPAGQPQLALLLEGQARYDADMTARMRTYMNGLWRALERMDLRQADGAPLELMPLVFHVGPHPWAAPWYAPAQSARLAGAVGLRPGTTIDVHAFASRPLPAANLVSCVIAWERACLSRNRPVAQVGQALHRILRQELAPLLTVPGAPLHPEAFASLNALEVDMVTWDEIKVALHQTGLEQGLKQGVQQGVQQGLEQGLEQGKAQSLAEFVALYWNEAMGQAFQARLAHREARDWPSLRALRAAYEAGRDPCALLDADGLVPGANGRPAALP